MRAHVAFGLCVSLCLVVAGSANAGWIGNDVSVGRGQVTDGAWGVLTIYTNSPVPSAGTIDEFAYFAEWYNYPTWPHDGIAYILHPLGGGVYHVLSATTFTNTVASSEDQGTKYIPLSTPVAVQAGDLIASGGCGVPYDTGLDTGFYPCSITHLTAGADYTIPGTSFPAGGFSRNYAFAAEFTAAPEPSALAMVAGALIALLAYAWRKRK